MQPQWQHIAVRFFTEVNDRVVAFTTFSHHHGEYLAELEADGWEHFSAVVLNDGTLLTFWKRPKVEDEPAAHIPDQVEGTEVSSWSGHW
jgi:hypothetical protein